MKFSPLLICFIFFGCKERISYPPGGYDYPDEVADKDTNFYFYPLKNILSRKDSFEMAEDYLAFAPFHEANLSLRHMKKDVFRLYYGGWNQQTAIITLTENSITLKTGYPQELYETDETRLTESEMHDLHLLRNKFPLDQKVPGENPYRRRYVDSLIVENPKLLDPAYYRRLKDKTIIKSKTPFNYTTTVIPVTNKAFIDFLNLLNASGFWSLPHDIKCKDEFFDGYSFGLEANTYKKYKVVSSTGCPGDTSKFVKVCQKLIKYAHFDKKINLISDGKIVVKDVQLEEIKEPRKKNHHSSSSK